MGKTFIRLIEFYVIKNFRIWVYLILIFIGLMIGFYCWLPLSLDISLVSLLFLKLGQLYKVYERFLNKFSQYIFLLIIWSICLANDIYIEFAVRSYPGFIISIIEAICGSFCIIFLCKYLERFNLGFLNYIGRCSLIILIVHSLEYILIDYSYLISIIGNVWVIFLKVLFVVVVSCLINNILKRVRMLR